MSQQFNELPATQKAQLASFLQHLYEQNTLIAKAV